MEVHMPQPVNWRGEAESVAMKLAVLSHALASAFELARTSLVDPDELLPLYALSSEIHGQARGLAEGAR